MTVVVVSSSALATLTVSHPVLKKDVLLHLITKLASPLQLTVVEKKKGHDLELKLYSGIILKERNAILRSLCGSALHYALDTISDGGHSTNVKASPVSAMALASIASWQSVADSIKHDDYYKSETAIELIMSQLNTYLETRSFLIPSATCTLADMDLAISIGNAMKKDTDDWSNKVPHFRRWMTQVYAVLEEYAAPHDDISIALPKQLLEPSVNPIPVFFYGTEDFVPPAVIISGKKQAKKAQVKKQTKQQQQQQATSTDYLDISALDIRVGKILKAWNHPQADKLYCEEIDVGEDKPRQIASGLRQFYNSASDDLENRMVVVLCNLKAKKMLGFPSHGMVLCASNNAEEEHSDVKFVIPPADSKIGERVVFDGIEMKEAEPENKVAKKKIFEKLAPDLKTNSNGVVVWKGHIASTSGGNLTAELKDAQVS